MKVKMNEWNRNEALCPQEDAECQITKVVTLPKENYRYFINHSQKEYDFIKENADQMGIRKRIRTDLHRCILLRCAESLEGVLINADGCGYAKYSAHLPSVGLLLQPDLFDFLGIMSSLNENETEAVNTFLRDVLTAKESILEKLDLEQVCTHIPFRELDMDLNGSEKAEEMLQKMILSDERIVDMEFDYADREVKLYPLYPKYVYDPVRVSEKKYFGEASMTQCGNNLYRILEECDPDLPWKHSVMIEKTLELLHGDFRFFSKNLRQIPDFLKEHLDCQYRDKNGTLHCVFIKSESSGFGFLICRDTDKGDFYAGYVPSLSGFCALEPKGISRKKK